MTYPAIVIMPPLGDPVDEMWEVLLDVAEQLKVSWTIGGGDSSRHYRDLAFLCSLIDDPVTLRDELTNTDRRNLKAGI